ncbi:MAG: YceI family protein [Alphaproteobacteria bacterium]|nr:YceI family protein [Alphaproteobacteria bacterium]
MKKYLAVFLALLACASPTPSFAKNWTVDYANSRLGFTATQGDKSFEGSFKNFQTTIDFDPAKPEAGKITATIDMISAVAGSAERDSALPQADWFDTKKFPQAQFASTSIKAAGTDKSAAQCFEAEGTLTIKGIERKVTLPFCLKPEDDHTRAKGKIVLMRNDFQIGQGQWASEAFVKNAVTVTVDIAAR